jgi:hypothetical protein
LGSKGQERIEEEPEERAERMQIEEPMAVSELALLPTSRISFFDHDPQVFRAAFATVRQESRSDLREWVIGWAKHQVSGKNLYFPSEWHHASISPREDDLNLLNDWSTRFAVAVFGQIWDLEMRSAIYKLRRCILEAEQSARRFNFTFEKFSHCYLPNPYGSYGVALRDSQFYPPWNPPTAPAWYSGVWDKALHTLDSAIATAKDSINAVSGAVDYASKLIASLNAFPVEPGNSTPDNIQFTFFINMINTFDLKSAWMNVESLWEQFSGQVSKLAFGTKGWPPNNHFGEVLDGLLPVLG